ncbi:hypothetical protein FTW19_17510 [Terriglobus albidus]|uniref:Uncharacterized protein n=1 Tax=Terriglobus albidus TaxID=1592106 RepID=A0A5B9EET2_9BACT|nr:hypothetical protein [Terriglobus albidus]QEE29625.1 hypothetical protein FTW19_17510 [Terriglobus albidus]
MFKQLTIGKIIGISDTGIFSFMKNREKAKTRIAMLEEMLAQQLLYKKAIVEAHVEQVRHLHAEVASLRSKIHASR